MSKPLTAYLSTNDNTSQLKTVYSGNVFFTLVYINK